MKTPVKFFAFAASIVILGVLVTQWPLIQAQSAFAQTPVPVVVNPTARQYRVIDIGKIPVPLGHTPTTALENTLNQMGSQGWSVVATTGSFIILMQ